MIWGLVLLIGANFSENSRNMQELLQTPEVFQTTCISPAFIPSFHFYLNREEYYVELRLNNHVHV
jgi:hypothetical protein